MHGFKVSVFYSVYVAEKLILWKQNKTHIVKHE